MLVSSTYRYVQLSDRACGISFIYVMCCAIWYHVYNLKNVKNTHGRVLVFNTLPWLFFAFFKLYKWYQIAQRITYSKSNKDLDVDIPETPQFMVPASEITFSNDGNPIKR